MIHVCKIMYQWEICNAAIWIVVSILFIAVLQYSNISLYPPLQWSWKGGGGLYWFHLVRLSVCGQNCVRSVFSTILIGSMSYSHILSSNFRRCVVCNVCFKFNNWKFWWILLICNFDSLFFSLSIQYDSLVWVIMRQREVSSERRHSSSSL